MRNPARPAHIGADALKQVTTECEKLGAKVEAVNLRPNSAGNCDKIVEAAVKRFGGVDILEHSSGRLYVLESNNPCYFASAQLAIGTDVSGAIVEYLLQKASAVAGTLPVADCEGHKILQSS